MATKILEERKRIHYLDRAGVARFRSHLCVYCLYRQVACAIKQNKSYRNSLRPSKDPVIQLLSFSFPRFLKILDHDSQQFFFLPLHSNYTLKAKRIIGLLLFTRIFYLERLCVSALTMAKKL